MNGSHILDNAALASALADHDVRHLRVSEAKTEWSPLDITTLITTLARHPQPRFREALIPLFLRHPDYSAFVPEKVVSLEPVTAKILCHMYTAAVYLQRLWHGTLGLYLGDFPLLPDYFGQTLPPPDDHYGEAGLRALADLQKQETGYEWLKTYQSVIALFLDQLRLGYGKQAR